MRQIGCKRHSMHYAVQSWTVSETFNRALVNMVSSNVSGVCRRRARGSRLRRDGQGRQGGPPASSARRCTNSRRRKRAWRSRGCDKLTRRAKFRLTRRANHFYKFARLTRQQGRIAIVTNAGWDAVDAAALGVTRDGRAGWRKTRERSAACRRPMLKRTAKPCGPGIRC